MDSQTFVENLKKCLKEDLPGKNAQFKMAGNYRAIESFDIEKAIQSSVLILLYNKNNELYFPLIERPIYDGVHSGQMALPGGKFDQNEDKDLIATALREANEEIGFEPRSDNFIMLGKLSELYIPPSNHLVHPYIGYTYEIPEFKINQREVAELIEVSVSEIINENLISEKKVKINSGNIVNAPCFEFNQKQIWGATAMMLSELKEITLKIKSEIQ